MKRITLRRGVTLVEVCLLIAVVVLILSIALPALAAVGCSSFRATSKQNLVTLVGAHAAYAADWDNRQFTMVPDDVGAFGGCSGYTAAGNCITGAELGKDCNGNEVTYSVGCGASAYCGNFTTVAPLTFGPFGGFGAFRIPNAAGFQPYVDGHFYSPTFYAPDDEAVIGDVEPLFALRCEYAGPPGVEALWSSYTTSPSAMFSTGVLSRQTGYHNPNSLADGYTSPPVTAAVYPNLKTRMMEYRAIEGMCNPVAGECNAQYQFNQMYEARPLGMMFDGSVRIISPREAMVSDMRVKATAPSNYSEKGLWLRNTPFGPNGFYGAQSYDFLVKTSYHILTGDGIAGRDVVE